MTPLVPISICFLLLLPMLADAREPDWQVYDRLLADHVGQQRKNGIALAAVDYPALARSAAFPRLVGMLAGFPTRNLQGRREKLAFFINAYNILTLKMILDHRPLKSIRDAGSLFRPVWKKPAGRIDGQTVTLDHIEHRVLRPLGEPRMHMAIVCASVSCPDLRREAYRAERLETQLESQTRAFLDNSGKGLSIDGTTVRLSKIFAWFKADFPNLETFLRKRRPDLPAGAALNRFLPYDWSLNEKSENGS